MSGGDQDLLEWPAADLRRAEGWLQIDLSEPAPAGARRRLLTILRDGYGDR